MYRIRFFYFLKEKKVWQNLKNTGVYTILTKSYKMTDVKDSSAVSSTLVEWGRYKSTSPPAATMKTQRNKFKSRGFP
jgi:hypothetical protein